MNGQRLEAWSRGLAVLAAFALLHACSDSGDDGPDENLFGNATGSMAGTDGNDTAGSGRSDAAIGELTPENACGIGNETAELAPVNMLIMFDRSGSMEDDNKWQDATAALSSFISDPAAAGLGVALRFFPHDEPEEGCVESDCDADACSEPLVDLESLVADPAPTDGHEAALLDAIESSAPGGEGDGTPIHAALDGALRWAADFDASHADENTVVVFVTDGKPNGCDEDFDHIAELASDALSQTGVLTYAIGLVGSSEAQMDQLAQAGGTRQGIFIGRGASAEDELLDTLNQIRGENLACDFAFPQAVDPDRTIDPNHVSVSFYYPSGRSPLTLVQVRHEDACGKANGWYYDDAQAPTRILLCPSACDEARETQDAGLQILIGCAEGDGTPLDCLETPDDPACRVE